MKKFLSILLLFAILLSVAACGAEEAATPTQETTQGTPTAEEMYGHINQMEPVDGVYKIWNAEGVKNIINHPDAKFELLCTVDMEGAVLAPIGADKPFTGEIKGANFFIKNFTVQGGDEENFGFIAVNQGVIRNLVLENVTFIPGTNAKNIGSLAGDNQGQILRCNVNSSTMTVESAPEGANCGSVVGINTGSLTNGIVWVDLAFNSEAAANVGGIIGTANGGTVEFVETDGKLDIVGTNKNYGLFAGLANDVVLQNCVFVGATNFAGGERFINFTGNPDDNEREVAYNGLWRDNEKTELTEGQQKLRDRVVEEMYNICTIEWHPDELVHTCYCTLSTCHGTYSSKYTHIGIPYNHKGGSLDRFKYCLNEDGTVKDWVYDMPTFDGYDAYIGNDCSTAVLHALWTVSNSVDFLRVRYQLPQFYDIGGCIAVGDYFWDFTFNADTQYTKRFWDYNTEQKMYEAYACVRKGDMFAQLVEAGGHTRMAAEDAVVVRDQDGLVNSVYSYVLIHEQGATWTDDTNLIDSTCKTFGKNSFDKLAGRFYIPITCEELITGEMEPAECTITNDGDGKLGLTTGYIKANYFLDSVTLKITDSQGNVVFDHKMFTTAARRKETGDNDQVMRNYRDDYNMAYFATPLQSLQLKVGETYSYSITARLGTYDEFLLKEDTFVNG